MPTGSDESRTEDDELGVLSDDDWAEIKKMLGLDWDRPGWTAPKKKKGDAEMNKIPFRFLGFDKTHYYVWRTGQNCVAKIGKSDSSIRNMLFDIADWEWWFTHFEALKRQGGRVLGVHECLAWFRREEERAGWFDKRRLLGVGVHKTDDGIWVNTGAELIKGGSGERVGYGDYDGSALFVSSRRGLGFSGKAWAEIKKVLGDDWPYLGCTPPKKRKEMPK